MTCEREGIVTRQLALDSKHSSGFLVYTTGML